MATEIEDYAASIIQEMTREHPLHVLASWDLEKVQHELRGWLSQNFSRPELEKTVWRMMGERRSEWLGQAPSKADEAAARLLLATARALQECIRDGMRPVTRERWLNDLAAALAPFDKPSPVAPAFPSALNLTDSGGVPLSAHAPGCPVLTDLCGNAECNCGAWDREAEAKKRLTPARLETLKEHSPFAPILHPDGEWTVSALGRIPQYAVVKTPHHDNAALVAEALNQWARGPDSSPPTDMRIDRLTTRRNELVNQFGFGPYKDGQTQKAIDAIDTELAQAGVMDRAYALDRIAKLEGQLMRGGQ